MSSGANFRAILFIITLALQISIIIGVDDIKISSFTQKLDHFGYYEDLVNVTFQQKIVVNDTQWEGARSRAPIFAFFGNERSQIVDPSSLGVLSLATKEFRAMLIYIEHRFYGSSIPLDSMELAMANHQIRGCLTTEQALRDFAVIIQSLKANLSSAFSPVIVMGTGYGGALATWFRLTYPEIAIGALASSTPMYYFGNATQQHDGYCSIVSQNFKDANENCYKSIRESWKKIDKIASEPNGLAKLGTTFNTCRPLESKVEIKDMLAQVYSYIAITNDPMDDHLNAFCYTIERGTIEGILLAVLPLLKLPGDCLNTVVTEVNSPFEPFSNWTVAWAWQRCSELIYPLGCREDTMLPSKPFDMTKFKQACHERFGVVPQPRTPISFFARKSLIDSLVGFGGNLIFSNGHRDPLSSAGILEDLSSTITAITTKRGTYASDMVLAISDINPAWLRNQWEEEMKILRRWINYYNHVKGSHFSVSYRIAYLVLGVILGFIAIVFVASTIIGYNIFRSLYSPV